MAGENVEGTPEPPEMRAENLLPETESLPSGITSKTENGVTTYTLSKDAEREDGWVIGYDNPGVPEV